MLVMLCDDENKKRKFKIRSLFILTILADYKAEKVTVKITSVKELTEQSVSGETPRRD